MNDSVVENLILDLLEWLAIRDRSYEEVMEAWRTSCPRLPVWEEANDRKLVRSVEVSGNRFIRPTSTGYALLEKRYRSMKHSPSQVQEFGPTKN